MITIYQLLLNACRLIILLTLISCSQQSLPPLNDDAVILAFGDSLTAGVGADATNSYPQALQRISGLKVISSGVSGETSAQGLTRFAQSISQHTPDLIILLEGGNDILRNLSQQQLKNNLAAMIQIAKQQQIPLILVGVPEKKLFSDSAPIYRQLAEEYELVFADEILAELIRSPEYKSDSVHLNAAGYEQLAQRLVELMRQHGAIE